MDRLANILLTLKHLDLKDDLVHKESVHVGFGGTCDVFTAWSKKVNSKVAIKRIRVFLRKDEKFAKKLAKEIRIWASLDHEHVLPFLGYFVEGEGAMPSLVSLWMVNGTLDDYMEILPRGGEETRSMLAGVSCGLNYLHSREVIHADLKSHNILVSQVGKPLLADFGLSSALSYTKHSTTAFTSATGTVRWMAIELFDSEPPIHTTATDVWAFGMVMFELLSGDIPYSKKADPRVPSLILEGKVPDRPENEDESALFDPLWEMCLLCWNIAPRERPTAKHLMDALTDMQSSTSITTPDMSASDAETGEDDDSDTVVGLMEHTVIDDSSESENSETVCGSPTIAQATSSKEDNMAKLVFSPSDVKFEKGETSPSSGTPAPEAPADVRDLLVVLKRMEPCFDGYPWANRPEKGGFECEDGYHFKSYSEVRASIEVEVKDDAPLRRVVKDLLVKLEKIYPCPDGHAWTHDPIAGGFRCEGGSHFKYYSETGILVDAPRRFINALIAARSPSKLTIPEAELLLATLANESPCPAGNDWVHNPFSDEGGFRCTGGTHFISYADARVIHAAARKRATVFYT